jgi:membrane-associated phospholipid phosphatase
MAFSGASVDGDWYTSVTGFARHTPWLHTPMTLFTDYGLSVFAVLFLLGWWLNREGTAAKMAAALWAPAVTVIVAAASAVLKTVVTEERPCRAVAHAYTLVACPGVTDYSFPSNHATIAVAAATAIFLVDRRLGLIAVVAAVIMGISRVYVGVHYPHDVLAGALLGVCCVLALAPFADRLLAPLVERLRTGRLQPIVGIQQTGGHG